MHIQNLCTKVCFSGKKPQNTGKNIFVPKNPKGEVFLCLGRVPLLKSALQLAGVLHELSQKSFVGSQIWEEHNPLLIFAQVFSIWLSAQLRPHPL